MRIEKQFNVKIYDQDGTTFLKGFSSKRPLSNNDYLKNTPTFESKINSGFGECVLDFALPFDDFDQGLSINMMNIVRIYAITIDHRTIPPTQSSDTLIYTGFMTKYEPYLNPGGDQGVRVTLLGLVSITAFSYYKSGSSYSPVHTTEDPSDIATAIIDHVNSIYSGSLLSYSGASVDTVGTTVSKTFSDRRWSEALEDTRLLAGAGWWSKIDEAGVYSLKQKPSQATHTFIIGKHIERLTAPKDAEKIVNDVTVRWNDGSDHSSDYSDATSQQTYGTGSPATGKRSVIVNDSGLNDSNAADQRGNKAIDDGKDAKIKASLTINANYDLESIKVGQTCSIRNLKGSFFADNVLIVSVRYNADTVDLELDDFSADFATEIAGIAAGSTSVSVSSPPEVTLNGVETLTNKRIVTRVGTVSDAATITPVGDDDDMFTVTALAQNATIAAPSGTPVDGQKLTLRIKDNGVSRTLTWNAIYSPVAASLPTATSAGKYHYIALIYNSQSSKWDVVSAPTPL